MVTVRRHPVASVIKRYFVSSFAFIRYFVTRVGNSGHPAKIYPALDFYIIHFLCEDIVATHTPFLNVRICPLASRFSGRMAHKRVSGQQLTQASRCNNLSQNAYAHMSRCALSSVWV